MIDVALTAASVRPAAAIVVIDVLRATTTITQALAGGFARVLCVAERDQALAMGGPGRVLAGEERCVPPPGFDLGNSPAAVEAATGTELVLATSNGTPAIIAAAGLSERTLLGSLANLDAVVAALRDVDDVLLVCSGTNGRLAIEDVYVAGRIVALLDHERTDAAQTTALLAAAAAPAGELFRASTNGRLLVEVGLEADIDWCVRESFLDLVPRVAATTGTVATVTAA